MCPHTSTRKSDFGVLMQKIYHKWQYKHNQNSTDPAMI